ncbi:hypothetical protein HDV01_000661 [Terramyces sp. JEL0728]|nr:hypothetical protein HDV01_000661 [Terramyces sp. JEL0728]
MSTVTQTSNADLVGLITAMVVQFAISCACFVGFSVLRPSNKKTYEPKIHFSEQKKKPAPLSAEPLAWLKPIMNLSESELVDKLGLDAVMFLKFVAFGVRFFVLASLLCIPLMVVYNFAPSLDKYQDVAQGITVNPSLKALSMQNLNKGSNFLYIPASLAYILSFFAYYQLYVIWDQYIALRKFSFTSPEYLNSTSNKTLLFTDIPEDMQNIPKFTEYIKSLNLKQTPKQVMLGRDYLELSKLVAHHLELTKGFENVLVKYLKNPNDLPNKRPTHKIDGFLGIGFLGGETVDSIDYYRTELLKVEKKIYTLRSLPDSNFKSDASGFVSFNSVKEAHSVANSLTHFFSRNALYSSVTLTPTVKLSPEFDDIIWDNVGLPPAIKRTRQLISYGLLAVMVLFWVALQSLVTSLSSLSTWNADVATSINNSPYKGLIAVVQSLISPALLAALNFLLPIFLRIIATLQGVTSYSGVERSAMYKYFVFQVYQFMVNIGLKLMKDLWDSILHPPPGQEFNITLNNFLKNFSGSFVSAGSFYINYVLAGYAFFGIQIIQAAPLILRYVKSKLLTFTPREEYEFNESPKFDYMPIYSYLQFSLLVGICYSLVAPLIVPFTALAFIIAYICMKYQFLYVYETKTETHGVWWPKVFNLICVCIGLFQLTTFGSLVIIGATVTGTDGGDGRAANLMVVFLVPATILFWLYVQQVMKPKADFVSKKLDVDAIPFEVDERLNSEVLKNKVFNPAVIKLLPKVWVKKDATSALPDIYKPDYKDVIDFVRQTDPGRLKEAQTQAKEREEQLSTLLRHRSKHITHLQSAASGSHLELQPDFDEKPPEFEGYTFDQDFSTQYVEQSFIGDAFEMQPRSDMRDTEGGSPRNGNSRLEPRSGSLPTNRVDYPAPVHRDSPQRPRSPPQSQRSPPQSQRSPQGRRVYNQNEKSTFQ